METKIHYSLLQLLAYISLLGVPFLNTFHTVSTREIYFDKTVDEKANTKCTLLNHQNTFFLMSVKLQKRYSMLKWCNCHKTYFPLGINKVFGMID